MNNEREESGLLDSNNGGIHLTIFPGPNTPHDCCMDIDVFCGMPSTPVPVPFGVLDNSEGRADCCLAMAYDSVKASNKVQSFVLEGSSSKYVIPVDVTPDCHTGDGGEII